MSLCRPRRLVPPIAAALLALPASAVAQPAGPGAATPDLPALDTPQAVPDAPPADADGPPKLFSAGGDASYLLPGDLRGVGGRVSRTTLRSDVGLRLPPVLGGPKPPAVYPSIFATAGLSSYRWAGDTTLAPPGVDPWGEVYTESVGASAFYATGGDWNGFAALNVTSAGEAGSDFGDTLTAGGVAAVTYAVSPDLTIGLGVVGQTRLEDSFLVIPFPTVEWTLPTDAKRRVTFSVGNAGAGSARGAGATLSYAAGERWTLSAAVLGLGGGGEFRLRDNGPTPGGVGRDRSYPAVLSATYRPRDGVELTGFAGASLFGTLELLDSRGDTVEDVEVNPSAIGGVSLTVRF